MGSTTWEQSALWGKCRRCFRLCGLVPNIRMCMDCTSFKVGEINRAEWKRQTAVKVRPLEAEWNWRCPF